MNTLVRWVKFSLVGTMGIAVQLTALRFFNRLLGGHYLCATALAIEITLLHNFVWHLRYTWRDRSRGSTAFRQLLRFHLSNGLVSMLGSLVLMRLLVRGAHLPLLAANAGAIVCCSIANFCLSNNWAFAPESRRGREYLPTSAVSS